MNKAELVAAMAAKTGDTKKGTEWIQSGTWYQTYKMDSFLITFKYAKSAIRIFG